MTVMPRSKRQVAGIAGLLLALTACSTATTPAAHSTAAPKPTATHTKPRVTQAAYTVGTPARLSTGCSGQNAENEQAHDAALGYVYTAWIGCNGIGFARSTDSGTKWSSAIPMPGTSHTGNGTWDPALAVARDGLVYVSFMIDTGDGYVPVVDVSHDHGATFTVAATITAPTANNFGDRDFLAVAPDGTLYLTWDYGPSRSSVGLACAKNGSCWFSKGELNAVIQKSTDGGKTWSAMSHVSPGFPDSGADSAPLLVQPDGTIDVLYLGHQVTNKPTDDIGAAHEYFTSSSDGGKTWSSPVEVGGSGGSIDAAQWWVNGYLSTDSAGNLYATWDTQGTNAQGAAQDTGWLAYSTDHGATWSAPIQAPTETANAPHIITSTGAGAGFADVAWLTSTDQGYAAYLRTYEIGIGWLDAPVQISTAYGSTSIWPGDTIGITALSPTDVTIAWGSATPADNAGKNSAIYAAAVHVKLS